MKRHGECFIYPMCSFELEFVLLPTNLLILVNARERSDKVRDLLVSILRLH